MANLVTADLSDDQFGPNYPLDREEFVNLLARINVYKKHPLMIDLRSARYRQTHLAPPTLFSKPEPIQAIDLHAAVVTDSPSHDTTQQSSSVQNAILAHETVPEPALTQVSSPVDPGLLDPALLGPASTQPVPLAVNSAAASTTFQYSAIVPV